LRNLKPRGVKKRNDVIAVLSPAGAQRGGSLPKWRVSTATRTRANTAKLNKISDEISPPFWQTARYRLAISF